MYERIIFQLALSLICKLSAEQVRFPTEIWGNFMYQVTRAITTVNTSFTHSSQLMKKKLKSFKVLIQKKVNKPGDSTRVPVVLEKKNGLVFFYKE